MNAHQNANKYKAVYMIDEGLRRILEDIPVCEPSPWSPVVKALDVVQHLIGTPNPLPKHLHHVGRLIAPSTSIRKTP